MPKKKVLSRRERKYRDRALKLKSKSRSRAANYFWAYEPSTRTLVGPADSEEECRSMAYTKTEGQFEVIPLPTRSRPAAAQMIKAKDFSQSHDLADSLRNMQHK